MVERLTPAFGCGDGYVQVFLDFVLPDEIIERTWPQAGFQCGVFRVGFPRYDTSYFNFTSE